MPRRRKPLTVYLLDVVREQLEQQAEQERKPVGTLAARIITSEVMRPQPAKPAESDVT